VDVPHFGLQIIQANPDVCRLLAANLGCWLNNVGQEPRILSANPGRNRRCLQVGRRMFVGRYKYMDLVANTIMLHNVSDLTDVLTGMVAEGWSLTKELVGRLSPYPRDHLRRFGRLMLDMDDLPPPLVPRSLGISEEGAGRDY
jgi:hypothetical protein